MQIERLGSRSAALQPQARSVKLPAGAQPLFAAEAIVRERDLPDQNEKAVDACELRYTADHAGSLVARIVAELFFDYGSVAQTGARASWSAGCTRRTGRIGGGPDEAFKKLAKKPRSSFRRGELEKTWRRIVQRAVAVDGLNNKIKLVSKPLHSDWRRRGRARRKAAIVTSRWSTIWSGVCWCGLAKTAANRHFCERSPILRAGP